MVDWKLYIDSPLTVSLNICRGSLTEGDGGGDGYAPGIIYGYGVTFGDGYGDGTYGYGNGFGGGGYIGVNGGSTSEW